MKLLTASCLLLSVCLFAGCKKTHETTNQLPVVNAGPDRTVVLNISVSDTISLQGSVTDADGKIASYQWAVLSGPNVPSFQSSEASNTVVSGLQIGVYAFRLSAVDNRGGKGADSVTITITAPEPVTRELSLRPGPSEAQSCIVAYRDGSDTNPWQTKNSNINSNPDITASAWTYGSQGLGDGMDRTYFRFTGLSAVPQTAVVVSAKLSLYGIPTGKATAAPQGNSTYTGSPYTPYGTNASWLKKVTGFWNATTITWNNRPGTTDVNQVAVPASTQQWGYNVLNLDVTNMVKEMVSNNQNYGFCLQLQNEQPLRSLSFGSSKSADSTIRPKLVVTYKL